MNTYLTYDSEGSITGRCMLRLAAVQYNVKEDEEIFKCNRAKVFDMVTLVSNYRVDVTQDPPILVDKETGTPFVSLD